jgi:uncharacterized phage protein (TIGR01671 family)
MREIRFKAILKGNTTFTAPFDWYDIKYMPEVDVIVQSTGLKDRKGVEIFEGDIVKDCDTSDLVFEVKWNDRYCGYPMPEEFNPKYVFSIDSVILEVLGNVYENPELLKK